MVNDSLIDVVLDFVSDYSVPIILCFILTLGVLGSLHLWFLPPKVCVQERVVTSIGGCTASGVCGVMLDEEQVDYISFPVVGRSVCTEWRR